jgi:hypothetical protein
MNADTGLEQRGVGPQGCEAGARPLGKRDVGSIERVVGSIPFRPCGGRGSLGKIRKTRWLSPRRGGERSVAAARNVWANESIRQKIIGHRMAVGGSGLGSGLVRRGLGVRGLNGALALLDEPPSDHGVGVFVEPLVEEGRDLLAKIRGVGKAREFVAVQGVAGSGEKEFPRRLGAVVGHVALRANRATSNVLYRSINYSRITSNSKGTMLWKNVQSEEKSVRACSGCAGDYEDPDRSAWEEDFEEETDFQEEAGDEPGAAE